MSSNTCIYERVLSHIDVDVGRGRVLYRARRAAGGSSHRGGRVSCCWWAREEEAHRGQNRDEDVGVSGNKVGRSLQGGQCRSGQGLRTLSEDNLCNGTPPPLRALPMPF